MLKLKNAGLSVGRNFIFQRGCIIDPAFCFLITIGNNVTLAPNVHILAHDASIKRHLNCSKIGLVEIGDNTFLGASTIVLPGVKIGKNCIVGAGSVVTKNIPEGTVVAGSPARKIGSTIKYLQKHKRALKTRPVYENDWLIGKNKKRKIKKSLRDGIGYAP